MNAMDDAGDITAREVDALIGALGAARGMIAQVIFGQTEIIDLSLITVLAGGHLLLVGVPGLAKTRLVESLGQVLGLHQRRVQCTPDLMPADILGSEILDEDERGKRSFRFVQGPVFTQLLMADEINRASPRTQSALLQAMQEGQVSVAGHAHDLPRPFHVLATQNPLEQEGTYPLPEAQLDRFMMQVQVGYPDRDSERRMMIATTGTATTGITAVLDGPSLIAAQRLVRQVPVANHVVDGILDLVRDGRPETSDSPLVRRHVAWGPGPRAAQALMLAVRARALLDGRYTPSLEDVAALAKPVLCHRMALNFSARAEGLSLDEVIDQLSHRLG